MKDEEYIEEMAKEYKRKQCTWKSMHMGQYSLFHQINTGHVQQSNKRTQNTVFKHLFCYTLAIQY